MWHLDPALEYKDKWVAPDFLSYAVVPFSHIKNTPSKQQNNIETQATKHQ